MIITAPGIDNRPGAVSFYKNYDVQRELCMIYSLNSEDRGFPRIETFSGVG